jgi:hypothetical protein
MLILSEYGDVVTKAVISVTALIEGSAYSLDGGCWGCICLNLGKKSPRWS